MAKPKPRQIDFGHRSDPGKSGFESAQRALNCYAEPRPDTSKGPAPVYAVPGTLRFDNGSGGLIGPCRGMINVFGKGLYVLCGTTMAFFDVNGNGTACSGTVAGSSQAIMAVDQETNPKIGIVTEGLYYTLDTATNTVSLASVANLPLPILAVTFIDGYFVFTIQDGRIFHSHLNDPLTVDALAFLTANFRSDFNVRAVTHGGYLVVLGQTSMELWQDVGTVPFAFAPIKGAAREIGCIAPRSVAVVSDSLFWVDDKNIVRVRTQGAPARVSTNAVERAISALSLTDKQALQAVATKVEGHDFYALTSTRWTYEYDLSTEMAREANARANGLVRSKLGDFQ